MSDAERLQTLENLVRSLAREVSALRAEVDRLAEAPRSPASRPAERAEPRASSPVVPEAGALAAASRPAPPPPRPEAGPRPSPRAARQTAPDIDLETLVGRYGAVAVAALTILMGVGAFVRWAIEHVRLGPEMRVVLGALGAAAVGAAGIWLRRRGHVRYGSIVLALALAMTHVVAWGAGPQLEVVAPEIALGAAALASAALALLAWRAAEELLFVVGVGGAFIAPFVTSSGGGSPFVLLIFGWLVFLGGAAGATGRRWRVANAVLSIAVGAYAGAAAVEIGTDAGLRSLAPLVFALACAWTAIALDRGRSLAWAVRAALVAAALLALPLADIEPPSLLRIAAVAGTVTAYARRVRVRHEWSGLVVEGVAVPLLFLCAALASFDEPSTILGAGLALAWAGIAAGVAAQAGAVRRDPHAFVAALCGGVALLLALPDRLEVLAPSFAAYGAALVVIARGLRAPLVLVPAVLSLLLGAAEAADLLMDRPSYRYTPFLTIPSLVAAAVLALWIAAGFAARRGGERITLLRDPEVTVGPRLWWGAAALVALLWGRQELAYAFSRDVANFLLIAYYAVTGVGAIAVGRARSFGALRKVGLALAVYADLKAIFTAAQISVIGLRVGSYLLSGFFLLAVGYWAWSARPASDEERGHRRPEPDTAPSRAG
jgi:uncharacterized membrane protein